MCFASYLTQSRSQLRSSRAVYRSNHCVPGIVSITRVLSLWFSPNSRFFGYHHLFRSEVCVSDTYTLVFILLILFFCVLYERYGTKHMLWYIMVCSMIGGISVSVTTGLGSAIVTTAMGDNQVCRCLFAVVRFSLFSPIARRPFARTVRSKTRTRQAF